MLKIGEFSQLCQVTVKTLHHYDQVGLLHPAEVDPFSNYRYYTLEQLPRIHRIMALKDMGLSLQQIGKILDHDLPTEQLRGMLLLKEAEAERQVAAEQVRLARIRFHIRQIDMEATMSQLDIRIKEVAPMRALAIRFFAASYRDLQRVGADVKEAAIAHELDPETNAASNGALPMHIIYSEEYTGKDMDMELLLPVGDNWDGDLPLANVGTMTVREVEGIAQAATYIFEGDLVTMNENLVNVQRWAADHDYKLCNEIRTVVLRGPFEDLDFSKFLREIQYPLEKA